MAADKIASYVNADYYGKESMKKTRQIVLLYEGVIRFLEHAKRAIEDKDYETRFNLLQKASNVIVGLHSALDFDRGGEISKTLSSFYSTLDLRIINLNRSNDLAECEDIISEIKKMHEAWEKIDNEYGKEEAGTNSGMTAYKAPNSEKPEPTDFSA